MTKTKATGAAPATVIQATPDNPHPAPPHGGHWERLKDGSLLLVEQTDMQQPASGDDAAQPKE